MEYLRELIKSLDSRENPIGCSYRSDRARAVHDSLRRPCFEHAWTLQGAANIRHCNVSSVTDAIDYQVFYQLYRGCRREKNKEWKYILEEFIATASPASVANDEWQIIVHVLTTGKLNEIKEWQQVDSPIIIPTRSLLIFLNQLRNCQKRMLETIVLMYTICYKILRMPPVLQAMRCQLRSCIAKSQ